MLFGIPNTLFEFQIAYFKFWIRMAIPAFRSREKCYKVFLHIGRGKSNKSCYLWQCDCYPLLCMNLSGLCDKQNDSLAGNVLIDLHYASRVILFRCWISLGGCKYVVWKLLTYVPVTLTWYYHLMSGCIQRQPV